MAANKMAQVILIPTNSGPSDTIGTRQISITKENPVIVVGRSSKNTTKNLLPDADNAYFDSPVMSRLHAWIKCDEDGKVVIADANSMHGTFVNESQIEANQFIPLESNSTVRFGNEVARGSETFPPKKFTVQIHKPGMPTSVQHGHGYGIASEDLVLPDSPYYSDEDDEDVSEESDEEEEEEVSEPEEDEVVITQVKSVKRVVPGAFIEWDLDEQKSDEEEATQAPPTEADIPTSAIRESLRRIVEQQQEREESVIEIAPPSRTIEAIDLTGETVVESKPTRMSIAALLGQQDRSRQATGTPIRETHTNLVDCVIPSDEDGDDDEYDHDGMHETYTDDDTTSEDQEMSNVSAPTTPVSEKSGESAGKTIPDFSDGVGRFFVPENPVPPTVHYLQRDPPASSGLDEVEPEVKEAWTSTWRSPLMSRFFATSSSSASSRPEIRATASVQTYEAPPAVSTPSVVQVPATQEPQLEEAPLTISRDSLTNLADRTKIAMEQVRKADAMHKRAHEFWSSRNEMKASNNVTPTKEGPENAYPTPTSAQQTTTVTAASVSVAVPPPAPATLSTTNNVPLWVRNFSSLGGYWGKGSSTPASQADVGMADADEDASVAEKNTSIVDTDSPCRNRGAEKKGLVDSQPLLATPNSPVYIPNSPNSEVGATGGVVEQPQSPPFRPHSPYAEVANAVAASSAAATAAVAMAMNKGTARSLWMDSTDDDEEMSDACEPRRLFSAPRSANRRPVNWTEDEDEDEENDDDDLEDLDAVSENSYGAGWDDEGVVHDEDDDSNDSEAEDEVIPMLRARRLDSDGEEELSGSDASSIPVRRRRIINRRGFGNPFIDDQAEEFDRSSASESSEEEDDDDDETDEDETSSEEEEEEDDSASSDASDIDEEVAVSENGLDRSAPFIELDIDYPPTASAALGASLFPASALLTAPTTTTTSAAIKVKSVMSMENFLEPTTQSIYDATSHWGETSASAAAATVAAVNPFLTTEASITAVPVATTGAGDAAQVTKKRKRAVESDDEDAAPAGCSRSIAATAAVAAPVERKIAPLPRRASTIVNKSSNGEEDQEMVAEVVETVPVIVATPAVVEEKPEEPETKRNKTSAVQPRGNQPPSWSRTFATALAGAVVGGVGVFAALVATAGEI